jgi:hypothetical protein
MDAQSPARWFASLSVQNKTLVLIRLVYEFTLIIRDVTTSPSDNGSFRKLHGIGEMEHVIAPYLIALNSDDAKRYADEALINLLFAMPDDYELGGVFHEAWRHATSKPFPPAH